MTDGQGERCGTTASQLSLIGVHLASRVSFFCGLGAVLILRACLSDDYKDAFKRGGKRRWLCAKEKTNESRRVSRLLVSWLREEEEREGRSGWEGGAGVKYPGLKKKKNIFKVHMRG